MATASKEATINKSSVTFNSLRDQAAIGLYFESTTLYGRMHDDHAEVAVRSLSVFGVDKYLLTKRATGRIIIQDGARMSTQTHQHNFRANPPTDGPLTAEDAFLTVMAAWQFATVRPSIAHIDVAAGRSTERLTVGAHTLVNEPFALPVGSKELAEVRSGNQDVVRRLARGAETIWLSLATAPPWEDGTPGHRVPNSLRNKKMAPDGLLSLLAAEIVAADPDKFPAWQAPGTDADSPTAKLPAVLRDTAHNELSWS